MSVAEEEKEVGCRQDKGVERFGGANQKVEIKMRRVLRCKKRNHEGEKSNRTEGKVRTGRLGEKNAVKGKEMA